MYTILQIDCLKVFQILLQMPIDLGLGLLEYGIRILGRIIWYDRIIDLAIDKLHNAIDEIAELREQFIIVLRNEIPPFELAVGSLFGSKIPGLAFAIKTAG